MLNLSAVSYRYPGADALALQAVDLTLQPGDIVGLLGPNGAGKTTLFSLLSGLLQPASGQLQWQQPGVRVGLIPQQLAFYSGLSIAENLAFFADMYQLHGAKRKQQLDYAIAACGLEPRLKQQAATLSGGWQRRLNFAIGILNPAQLYLFDEATVGVDAQSRQLLLQAVQQLAVSGKTLVYTSHYLQEIEQIANRILVLQHGRLVLDVAADALAANQTQLMVQWPEQIPDGFSALLQQWQLTAAPLPSGAMLTLQSTAQWQALNQFILAQPVQPLMLRYGRPSLEQLYLHVTGGQL